MKLKLTILALALSTYGCAAMYDHIPLKPNTKLITLKHSKSFRDLREKDCNLNKQEFNCAFFNDKKCIIVIYRPTEIIQIIPMIPKERWSEVHKLEGKAKQEFLNRYYTLALGHELRHCFEGQWH